MWNLNPVYLPLHPTPSLTPHWGKTAFSETGRVCYAPTWPLLAPVYMGGADCGRLTATAGGCAGPWVVANRDLR